MDWGKVGLDLGQMGAIVFIVWWGMARAEKMADGVLTFLGNHLSVNTSALKDVAETLGGLKAKVDECPERGKRD